MSPIRPSHPFEPPLLEPHLYAADVVDVDEEGGNQREKSQPIPVAMRPRVEPVSSPVELVDDDGDDDARNRDAQENIHCYHSWTH